MERHFNHIGGVGVASSSLMIMMALECLPAAPVKGHVLSESP